MDAFAGLWGFAVPANFNNASAFRVLVSRALPGGAVGEGYFGNAGFVSECFAVCIERKFDCARDWDAGEGGV